MKFLKWNDSVIGKINTDFSVDFIDNEASLLADPDSRNAHWSAERFVRFLDDRVISRQRRDIEKILFRLGLSSFDIFKIAERTNAINAKDLLWVTDDENALFSDAITDVFESVFIKKVDSIGGIIRSKLVEGVIRQHLDITEHIDKRCYIRKDCSHCQATKRVGMYDNYLRTLIHITNIDVFLEI